MQRNNLLKALGVALAAAPAQEFGNLQDAFMAYVQAYPATLTNPQVPPLLAQVLQVLDETLMR